MRRLSLTRSRSLISPVPSSESPSRRLRRRGLLSTHTLLPPDRGGRVSKSVANHHPRPVSPVISISLTVASFGYLLPWAIAAQRGQANHSTILAINLVTGWTIVGWFIALIMACSPHRTSNFSKWRQRRIDERWADALVLLPGETKPLQPYLAARWVIRTSTTLGNGMVQHTLEHPDRKARV